jgi:hypothetical protein
MSAAGRRRYDGILRCLPRGGRVRLVWTARAGRSVGDGGARVAWFLRVGGEEPQDFGGMAKSCRTRPAGGGCAALTRRAGAAGFTGVRLAESPIACGLRLRQSARAGCHWHPAGCGPGRGVEGVRLGSGRVGFTHPTDRRSRPAGFWRYDKILASTRPAGGGCASLTRRAGTAGFATVQSGGEPYRLRSRSGDRPARGATGTPQGAGRARGGRGESVTV